MKKSLIALAAIGFVGAAAAQSSVTLYGIADIWVGKPEGGKVQAGSGGVAESRFGIKGSEDLGGGLKAVFTFESGINLGNGSLNGTLFNRQANVGLEGGFGTIKAGQNWNALDDIFGAANSGFDSALSANAVWQNGYTGEAAAQLYYATPEFSGFSGAISTQLNGNTANGANKITAFHAKYANGPVYVGLGYENDKGIARKGTLLNGSYDLGAAKLLASYYTTKASGATPKINSYQIGADIPMGAALTLSVGYASSKATGGQSATGFGVAAAYALSKRTTLYGGLRATNNVAGNDLWAVGVNHKF
jgi:predicted porin